MILWSKNTQLRAVATEFSLDREPHKELLEGEKANPLLKSANKMVVGEALRSHIWDLFELMVQTHILMERSLYGRPPRHACESDRAPLPR
jgi:hypothetical protein